MKHKHLVCIWCIYYTSNIRKDDIILHEMFSEKLEYPFLVYVYSHLHIVFISWHVWRESETENLINVNIYGNYIHIFE